MFLALFRSSPYNAVIMAETSFRYRVFGFTVATTQPFPFLWPETDVTRPADIHIQFRSWPEPETAPSQSFGMVTLYGTDCIVLSAAPGQRFICMGGTHIIVDLLVPLSDAELQTFVFGRPFGWLMHQRGLVPWHAALVRVGDVAIALAGHSGAGKSTLARAMVGRGHRMISDDLAVIDLETLLVAPGFPSLKLWENAARAHGDDVDRSPAVRQGTNKFHVALPGAFAPQPVPLAMVVAIGRDPARSGFILQRLGRRQSEAMLYGHTFNEMLARQTGSAATLFHAALAIAAKVPVFSLERGDQMAELPLVCAEIERLAQLKEPA